MDGWSVTSEKKDTRGRKTRKRLDKLIMKKKVEITTKEEEEEDEGNWKKGGGGRYFHTFDTNLTATNSYNFPHSSFFFFFTET